MPEPIFKDAHYQQLFEKQGFVVVPFLSPDEVAGLTDFFHQSHPQLSPNMFVSSSYSSNYAYKKRTSDFITQLFTAHFENYFAQYRAIGAAFLYKTPGNSSNLTMHQDWTIVDEKQFVSINVWVPLTDTNEQNGTLFVLPGSHTLLTLRAPTLPFFFTGKEHIITKELVPLNIPAGCAVILNHNLIHYSPPNLTNNTRIAITAGITHQQANLLFYYKTPHLQNTVEVFEQDPDFLLRFDNFHQDIFNRPKIGKSIGFLPYTPTIFPEKELTKLISQMKRSAGYTCQRLYTDNTTLQGNNSWWQKIFNIINPKRKISL